MATKIIIWDLEHPGCDQCGGQARPAQILMWSTDAGDFLERAPSRYVRELPDGVAPGPHHGSNWIVH
jgi:hypothetical protein